MCEAPPPTGGRLGDLQQPGHGSDVSNDVVPNNVPVSVGSSEATRSGIEGFGPGHLLVRRARVAGTHDKAHRRFRLGDVGADAQISVRRLSSPPSRSAELPRPRIRAQSVEPPGIGFRQPSTEVDA